MTLTVVLLLCLTGAILSGLWLGFVHMLGTIAGSALTIFLTGRFYEPLAVWLHQWTGMDSNVLQVVAFLFLFIFLNRLVGAVFALLEKMFGFLKIIPFLGIVDHLLGGLFGFVEGIIVLGLTMYVLQKIPVGPISPMVKDSGLAQWMMQYTAVLLPLLPKALRIF